MFVEQVRRVVLQTISPLQAQDVVNIEISGIGSLQNSGPLS